VAQKIIKGPVDDNSLNSTNHNFTELYNGKRKANERINNIVDEMSDEAFNKVVNSAKLDWDTMVEKYSDLPSDAEKGVTVGVKEDGKVYRYDGSKWVDIYEINLNPISEVDDRLSSQLAQTDNRINRNPMLPITIPTYDGSNQTTHPDVLYFENGWNGSNYWMVHTPYPYSDEKIENPSIARSTDGVHWTDPVGLKNPIDEPTEQDLLDKAHFSDGVLVMVGETMECWYRYVNRKTDEELFFRRKSTDGVNWSDREIVYNRSNTGVNRMLSPTIIHEDGKYRMWYVGTGLQVFYTESIDGKSNWTKEVEVPIDFIAGEESFRAWHIDVVKEDGLYHLVATTHVPTGDNRKRRLFWAISHDGLSFENGKIILKTSEKGFDNGSVYRCSLVVVDDGYLLYYGSRNTQGMWKVGLVGGETVDTMKGILPYNRFGNFLLDRLIVDYLELIQGDIDELTVSGKLIAPQLITTGIQPTDDYGVKFYGRNVFGPTLDDEAVEPYIKMNSSDNKKKPGAGFKLNEEDSHMIDVVRNSGARGGHLNVGAIILNGDGLYREGALRFNSNTKKHEGFDGTKWNALY